MVKPLFKVNTPNEVITMLKDHLNFKEITQNNIEEVNIKIALHRFLAEEVVTPANLPGFNRSIMDGYAIRAEDSFGATDSLPSYLNIIGEVKMGVKPEFKLNPGEAVKISTGGMLPEGANAVMMVEYTEQIDDTTIEARRSISPWENVVRENEDLKKGEIILRKGHRLRPQDIGVLAGIGKTNVKLYRKPKIAIISTGNVYRGIIKDEVILLEQEIKKTIKEDKVEAVIISGGSSVGVRDVTLEVLNRLGKPGVLIHGVSVKPGKPTILAIADNRPIFGLPGHPVSAMIIFDLFVRPLISWLQGGEDNYNSAKKIEAELTCNVVSDSGREDYVRVFIYKEGEKFYAEPILGKSGLISTMVRASGLIKIELNIEGLEKGNKVIVRLF